MRRLAMCVALALAVLSPAARAQTSEPMDYRGVALGMTLEEFHATIDRASCITIDFMRPTPDYQDCEDPSDVANYLFVEDSETPGTWRLYRIIVPGTVEDYGPFLEGMDRKFNASSARAAVAGGIRWTRGRQTVTVRRAPCNEPLRGILYRGTCALYSDLRLQAQFDEQRRQNQRRDF